MLENHDEWPTTMKLDQVGLMKLGIIHHLLIAARAEIRLEGQAEAMSGTHQVHHLHQVAAITQEEARTGEGAEKVEGIAETCLEVTPAFVAQ